jgi:hypothetical protein
MFQTFVVRQNCLLNPDWMSAYPGWPSLGGAEQVLSPRQSGPNRDTEQNAKYLHKAIFDNKITSAA